MTGTELIYPIATVCMRDEMRRCRGFAKALFLLIEMLHSGRAQNELQASESINFMARELRDRLELLAHVS